MLSQLSLSMILLSASGQGSCRSNAGKCGCSLKVAEQHQLLVPGPLIEFHPTVGKVDRRPDVPIPAVTRIVP